MSDLGSRLWSEVWFRIWRLSPRAPFVSFDGKHYRVGFFNEDGTADVLGMCDSLESATREAEAKARGESRAHA